MLEDILIFKRASRKYIDLSLEFPLALLESYDDTEEDDDILLSLGNMFLG